MTTLAEVAEQYGVSKSTATRWARTACPEAFGHGGKVDLSRDQLHALADHVTRVTNRDDANHDSVGDAVDKQGASCGDGEKRVTGKRVMTRVTGEDDANRDAVVMRLHELEIEAAELRARVAGLESENELLRGRLEQADKALEREQMQARGFWNRLGQKLLGGRKE